MSVSNTLSYYFWWSILTTIRIIQYVVIAIVPNSVVESAFRAKFERNGIKVTTKEEEQSAPKKPADAQKYGCEMVVHNKDLYKRVANNGVLALGEAYMDGWWDSDDLCELASRFIGGFKPSDLPLNSLYNKVAIAKNQQTREMSLRVAEEHYDLGNDLYEVMLDPTMCYTCAYWKDAKTLEQAQINKLDLVARKLQLKPGMKLLELGCGFGGAAKYMAKNYGVSVVAYNISKEQIAFARNSCKGLDVEFRLEDYRNATGVYDRIYSIGLFEHVGVNNYRSFFKLCDRCLKDDGLFLLHSITVKDHSQPRTSRWLDKYIFPGGELPYPEDYHTFPEGLFVAEDVHNFGYNYKLTLLEWNKNFEANWDKLKEKYDKFYDGKFKRMWRFYLLLCAGLFDCRALTLFQVVYSKKGMRGGYESVR